MLCPSEKLPVRDPLRTNPRLFAAIRNDVRDVTRQRWSCNLYKVEQFAGITTSARRPDEATNLCQHLFDRCHRQIEMQRVIE